MLGEGGISESGTVHTSLSDAAHAMGRSQKAVGRFDDLFRLGATGIQFFPGATVNEGLHTAVGDHRRGSRQVSAAAGRKTNRYNQNHQKPRFWHESRG